MQYAVKEGKWCLQIRRKSVAIIEGVKSLVSGGPRVYTEKE